MQCHRTWSWASLGVFMISLHLPAFSARSISWTKETTLQDLGSDPLLPGYPFLPDSLGPSILDHPLSGSSGAIVPLEPDGSLFDPLWHSGNSGLQGTLQDEGASAQGDQASDETWQMMTYSSDDSLPDTPSDSSSVEPSVASGSQTVVTPSGSISSSPDIPSLLKVTEPKRSLRSGPLGLQRDISAQHRPLSPINWIRQKPLPGHPWGTQVIHPVASWGGQGLGTGCGRRPLRLPEGSWGISNQYPGTSWGNPNQYPGTSWGNNKYPGTSWGISNQYPGTSWGNLNQYPGSSWGNNKYPGTSWGGSKQYPSTSWGINARYPGTNWGINNWYPSINWGGNNRFPRSTWEKHSQNPGSRQGINN